MLIGVICYDINHLKTEQILLGFINNNYEIKIYLLPFIERQKRDTIFKHRPDYLLGAHPREIAKKFGLDIQYMPNDKCFFSKTDFLIFGGRSSIENIVESSPYFSF